VLEREPIAPDDPLLSLPNVVLTPHAAFYSRESIGEMKRRAARPSRRPSPTSVLTLVGEQAQT